MYKLKEKILCIILAIAVIMMLGITKVNAATYTVTYGLEHITSSNTNLTATDGEDYITTLTADDGYAIDNVSIFLESSMDFAIEDTDYTFDKETGKVTIFKSAINGNFEINSTAEKKHTVMFNTNGGSEIAPVTVLENNYIDLDNYTPTKDGYKFNGWYSDKELTQRVSSINGSDITTDEVTVYGEWSIPVKSLNITFNTPIIGDKISDVTTFKVDPAGTLEKVVAKWVVKGSQTDKIKDVIGFEYPGYKYATGKFEKGIEYYLNIEEIEVNPKQKVNLEDTILSFNGDALPDFGDETTKGNYVRVVYESSDEYGSYYHMETILYKVNVKETTDTDEVKTVSSNIEDTNTTSEIKTSNPKTGDSISIFVATFALSVIGIGTLVYKKINKSKNKA